MEKDFKEKETDKPVSGKSYTGEITEINKTHVLQVVKNRTIAHNRAALSGLNKFKEHDNVEIKYPVGNAGIVKKPQTEINREKEKFHDHGSRER